MIGVIAAVGSALLLGASAHGNLVDEAKYAESLSTYVKDARVDYAGLKAHRANLDEYLKEVAAVPKADFDKAPKEAQMAYLINAYNAYTLETIIDAIPIKGGFFGGANSIRGISGAWDGKKHKTALGEVTLDTIEHDNLRKNYGTPFPHMTLVCASKGCPPLRSEPYYADKLTEQFEDQAKAYLASPRGLVVDGSKVKVTKIFSFKKGTAFADDFKVLGGWKAFVIKYCPDGVREKVKAALDKDDYGSIDYDWTLNEQEAKKS